jgi:hypothetical protein
MNRLVSNRGGQGRGLKAEMEYKGPGSHVAVSQ